MRRRLLIVLMLLMGVASIALSIPLAESYAHSRTEQLLLQRRTEAARFANLSVGMTTPADRAQVSTEIQRYSELYGASVELVDGQGHLVLRAGPGPPLATSSARQVRDRALTGRTTDHLPAIRPWSPDRVVLAEPVGGDEQLGGALLMALPTDAARHDVTVRWSLIALAALAAFATAALVAVWITRWLLRPVRNLDNAVDELAAGNLEPAAVPFTGPPELRRLEQRFYAMAQAVADSMRKQRDFVADASHQLRNPLATLILQLENIEPHLLPSGRKEQARAVDEVERLGNLLDSLLALAQVESFAEDLALLDVSRDARHRLAAWQGVYEAAGLDLVDAVADGIQARGLPSAVDRVLDAALDNAAKFVPVGGRVEVRAVECDGWVRVQVSDDGPGLPAEQLSRLPRRFTRGLEHQNLPGSGLGLAIADEIARMSGGRLTLRGNSPHGIRVDMVLPGLAPPGDGADTPAAQP
ncbi:HAMP domain-containing sensor histidine kinase [Streptomyces sp. NPDC051320]|uniref:HAMP domain-containing sensor histidine kinase n=1 Tax=Streptomyces sp. NPDC051320 TaxID=3154644 RepID=UPI0034224A86